MAKPYTPQDPGPVIQRAVTDRSPSGNILKAGAPPTSRESIGSRLSELGAAFGVAAPPILDSWKDAENRRLAGITANESYDALTKRLQALDKEERKKGIIPQGGGAYTRLRSLEILGQKYIEQAARELDSHVSRFASADSGDPEKFVQEYWNKNAPTSPVAARYAGRLWPRIKGGFLTKVDKEREHYSRIEAENDFMNGVAETFRDSRGDGPAPDFSLEGEPNAYTQKTHADWDSKNRSRLYELTPQGQRVSKENRNTIAGQIKAIQKGLNYEKKKEEIEYLQRKLEEADHIIAEEDADSRRMGWHEHKIAQLKEDYVNATGFPVKVAMQKALLTYFKTEMDLAIELMQRPGTRDEGKEMLDELSESAIDMGLTDGGASPLVASEIQRLFAAGERVLNASTEENAAQFKTRISDTYYTIINGWDEKVDGILNANNIRNMALKKDLITPNEALRDITAQILSGIVTARYTAKNLSLSPETDIKAKSIAENTSLEAAERVRQISILYPGWNKGDEGVRDAIKYLAQQQVLAAGSTRQTVITAAVYSGVADMLTPRYFAPAIADALLAYKGQFPGKEKALSARSIEQANKRLYAAGIRASLKEYDSIFERNAAIAKAIQDEKDIIMELIPKIAAEQDTGRWVIQEIGVPLDTVTPEPPNVDDINARFGTLPKDPNLEDPKGPNRESIDHLGRSNNNPLFTGGLFTNRVDMYNRDSPLIDPESVDYQLDATKNSILADSPAPNPFLEAVFNVILPLQTAADREQQSGRGWIKRLLRAAEDEKSPVDAVLSGFGYGGPGKVEQGRRVGAFATTTYIHHMAKSPSSNTRDAAGEMEQGAPEGGFNVIRLGNFPTPYHQRQLEDNFGAYISPPDDIDPQGNRRRPLGFQGGPPQQAAHGHPMRFLGRLLSPHVQTLMRTAKVIPTPSVLRGLTPAGRRVFARRSRQLGTRGRDKPHTDVVIGTKRAKGTWETAKDGSPIWVAGKILKPIAKGTWANRYKDSLKGLPPLLRKALEAGAKLPTRGNIGKGPGPPPSPADPRAVHRWFMDALRYNMQKTEVQAAKAMARRSLGQAAGTIPSNFRQAIIAADAIWNVTSLAITDYDNTSIALFGAVLPTGVALVSKEYGEAQGIFGNPDAKLYLTQIQAAEMEKDGTLVVDEKATREHIRLLRVGGLYNDPQIFKDGTTSLGLNLLLLPREVKDTLIDPYQTVYGNGEAIRDALDEVTHVSNQIPSPEGSFTSWEELKAKFSTDKDGRIENVAIRAYDNYRKLIAIINEDAKKSKTPTRRQPLEFRHFIIRQMTGLQSKLGIDIESIALALKNFRSGVSITDAGFLKEN
jgi:hypothetical protein